MATLNIPNSFTNGYVANANEVNANFQSVKTFVESSVLQSDTKTVFLAPVGSITMYTGVTAPAGWLLCNGTSTAGYTALAALVGANTPNLQGRFPIGDNGTLALNGTGGSLTIGVNNLPAHSHPNTATFTGTAASHNHTQDAHTHEMNYMGANEVDNSGVNGFVLAGASFDTVGGTRGNANTTATNQATTITPSGTVTMTNANNTTTASDYYQPYYVVNFIIKHD
jgi:microcystin-dependent protein